MNTTDCIRTRRSVRVFENKKIPHETMEQIVDLARYAPSWKNTQVARYLVVEEPEDIGEIGRKYASFNSRILSTCGALIALTALKQRSGYERDGSFSTDRGDGWTMFDSGIAAQTFCLAAHEMGIGTVILGIFDRAGLQEYLKIPGDQELVALIAAGYPAEEPNAPKRKEVEQLLTYWKKENQ